MCKYCYLNTTHTQNTACIHYREPTATCFSLNPWTLHPWVMTYVTTACEFNDLILTFAYGVHLLFQQQ